MKCEHWECLRTEFDLFVYGNCRLCNQRCYCNGVKEDCDYKKEEENATKRETQSRTESST